MPWKRKALQTVRTTEQPVLAMQHHLFPTKCFPTALVIDPHIPTRTDRPQTGEFPFCSTSCR